MNSQLSINPPLNLGDDKIKLDVNAIQEVVAWLLSLIVSISLFLIIILFIVDINVLKTYFPPASLGPVGTYIYSPFEMNRLVIVAFSFLALFFFVNVSPVGNKNKNIHNANVFLIAIGLILMTILAVYIFIVYVLTFNKPGNATAKNFLTDRRACCLSDIYSDPDSECETTGPCASPNNLSSLDQLNIDADGLLFIIGYLVIWLCYIGLLIAAALSKIESTLSQVLSSTNLIGTEIKLIKFIPQRFKIKTKRK